MKERLKQIFGLRADQERNERIRARIESGAQVTGTNMYILIFAILIACIGLNMDSTAVVIGAMLISPIMGAIVSVAYGLASNELGWIKKSLQKFAFQISISIITSTLYFLVSPMRSFSGELLARTQPTLWDVLIALFGGFAAIIASTRKNIISNVIPGAAIATALMPPICTVGYCIARGKWMFALGAAYLFVINVIFICLASVIGLRLMKITAPDHSIYTKKKSVLIGILIVISVVPSAFLAWTSVKGALLEEEFRNFIKHEFRFQDTQVVKSNLVKEDKTAEVMLVGAVLEEDEVETIEAAMTDYQLQDYTLEIVQTHVEQGITKEELSQYLTDEEETLESDSKTEVSELTNLIKIQSQEKELQVSALKELKILYPSIQSAGFSDLYAEDGKTTFSLILVMKEELDEEEAENVREWLKEKFKKSVTLIQFKEDVKPTIVGE